MENQKQVCTYFQAQKLKQLNIKQQSIWYWQRLKKEGVQGLADQRLELFVNVGHPISKSVVEENFSAYTVAELGVMIPDNHLAIRTTTNDEIGWEYFKNGSLIPVADVATEAQCRANILIHLLENNLITANEVNKRLTE